MGMMLQTSRKRKRIGRAFSEIISRKVHCAISAAVARIEIPINS
jgi:hypothetical protein